MVWIFVVISVVVAWVFIRFLMDFNKQRNIIAAKGGIKIIYKPLIDGLLEYRSACITQDEKDFLTISSTFIEPAINMNGYWSVTIQPVFKTLNVQYHANLMAVTDKQTWEFPVNTPQQEILFAVKEKIDELITNGIIR